MSDQEARIAELESRLAFQDDSLQSLSDALYAQQRLIERLEMQMAALLRRVEDMRGQLPAGGDDVPPPHY